MSSARRLSKEQTIGLGESGMVCEIYDYGRSCPSGDSGDPSGVSPPVLLIVPHIFVDASESDPVLNNSLVPNSLVKTDLRHSCRKQVKIRLYHKGTKAQR